MVLVMLYFLLFVGGLCKNSYIWQISDPHTSAQSGPQLSDLPIDMPLEVVDFVLGFIEERDSEYQSDAVIFLGDVSYHNFFITKEEREDINTEFFELFKKHLGNKEVYVQTGNHDGFPVDQLSVPNEFFGNWELDQFSEFQSHFIDSESVVDFYKKNGYYSSQLGESEIKIIMLQTQWSSEYNYRENRKEKMEEQLLWLENELEEVRSDPTSIFRKVMIFGHIPPNDWKRMDLEQHDRFLRLLERYSDITMLVSFAHSHLPRFALLNPLSVDLMDDKDIFSVEDLEKPSIISSSSLVPIFQGPGIAGEVVRACLFEYDAENLELIDVHIFGFPDAHLLMSPEEEDTDIFHDERIEHDSYRLLFGMEDDMSLLEGLERTSNEYLASLIPEKGKETEISPLHIMDFVEFMVGGDQFNHYFEEDISCLIMGACTLRFIYVDNIIECMEYFKGAHVSVDEEKYGELFRKYSPTVAGEISPTKFTFWFDNFLQAVVEMDHFDSDEYYEDSMNLNGVVVVDKENVIDEYYNTCMYDKENFWGEKLWGLFDEISFEDNWFVYSLCKSHLLYDFYMRKKERT